MKTAEILPENYDFKRCNRVSGSRVFCVISREFTLVAHPVMFTFFSGKMPEGRNDLKKSGEYNIEIW